MFSRLKHFADGAYDEDPNPYTVSWKECLGEGAFGVVFPVSAASAGAPPLAIKFCKRTADVEPEVRRFMACAGVPQIVRLLDIAVFVKPQDGRPSIGLVFERFEFDLRTSLKNTFSTKRAESATS